MTSEIGTSHRLGLAALGWVSGSIQVRSNRLLSTPSATHRGHLEKGRV